MTQHYIWMVTGAAHAAHLRAANEARAYAFRRAAKAMGGPAARALSQIGAWITGAIVAPMSTEIGAARRRAATLRALEALSDRELADIGVVRADIAERAGTGRSLARAETDAPEDAIQATPLPDGGRRSTRTGPRLVEALATAPETAPAPPRTARPRALGRIAAMRRSEAGARRRWPGAQRQTGGPEV